MNSYDELRQIFESVAKKVKKSVGSVSVRDIRPLFGTSPEKQIAKLGGMVAVKKKLGFDVPVTSLRYGNKPRPDLPNSRAKGKKSKGKKKKPAIVYPPNPLTSSEAQDLHGHDLSEYVADVIRQCSEELQRPAHELTWNEFARFINFRWGKNDKGIARDTITRAGGFNAIKHAYFPPTPTPIVIEKQRLQEHAKLNRKLGSELAGQQFIMDRLEEFASRIFTGKVHATPCGKSPHPSSLTLVLSDLHIGADLKKEECGVQFGKLEESRRLASLVRQTCKYGSKNLRVLLLGDIFQNWLHGPSDGAEVAEQMARAIHLLGQVITVLASHFNKVDVDCQTGNHGRLPSRHPKRATSTKWASLETAVYVAIKQKCSELKNVSFSIPKMPYSTYEYHGHKFFATHGDTVFDPGSGKVVQVERLETQINRINASLPDSQEYGVFIMGHIHQPTVVYTSSGACVLINGALIPSDQYAKSIGIFETRCGQWLFRTGERAIEELVLLPVGPRDDSDTSLDSVIKPWVDL